MKEYLIFAGTIEGRTLAETLVEAGKKVHICVATEYGEEVLTENPALTVHCGRLTEKEMENLINQVNPDFVIDATHPYAVEVSENISQACQIAGKEYVRLLREESTRQKDEEGITRLSSLDEATSLLNDTEGNILLTTGSKELARYVENIDDKSRIYARILPDGKMVENCREMGLSGKQIICMQGPFSCELNTAMIKQLDIKYLVTKDTGASGGFPEKVRAAKGCGVELIVIGRPKEESGLAIEALLEKYFPGIKENNADEEGHDIKRNVTLLGIGMGTLGDMTMEAYDAVEKADVIIGASRMTEALKTFGKEEFCSYRPDEIREYIENHPEKKNIVVALSGDVGFYSGAKKLIEKLDGCDAELNLICGISSVVYFASKLKTSWEDMKLVSSHGRKQNLMAAVKANRKVFSLAGYADSVRDICKELVENGLSHVKVSAGCQLSYPEESIRKGSPEELLCYQAEGLCVILIENPDADNYVITHGLPDEVFERGNAPMTKEEVRSISLSKLALTKGAVVYDVGAGTGSVSLECALQAFDGTVYAIERKDDALELLEKNKAKLGVSNLEIVRGLAPEAMENLPAPTHAFIGGSGGNMADIVNCLLDKNPAVRIVINCIALETVAEVMEIIKEKQFSHVDIAAVSVAKSKTLGRYHMMMGQNPVYIVTLQEESQ